MDTQLENSCVLKECLSGRSMQSFDEESDTNSVVYNKNDVSESPCAVSESPCDGESKEDEALPMSLDFVEDDSERFSEKKEKKSVSMGERLKSVWTRLGDGEDKKKKEGEEKKKKEGEEKKKKEGEEKKKKEGEEKGLKFSMLLPMGKAKKEGEMQMAKKEEEKSDAVEVKEEGEEGNGEKGEETQEVKKEGEAQMAKKGKWEIDQRNGMG